VAGGESICGPGCLTTTLATTRNGAPVVITAGHSAAGTYTLGNATTTAIGDTLVRRNHGFGDSDPNGWDAQVIANTGNGGQIRNCIVRTSTCVPIDFDGNTTLVQNATIYKAGSTTGENSGIITYTYVAEASPSPNHWIETSACTIPGDSGGPLYYDN